MRHDGGVAFPKKAKRKTKDPEAAREKLRVGHLLAGIKGSPCSACGKAPPSDPDHIRSRGSGGLDREENLWPLCRKCHTERHWFGLTEFVQRNPKLKETLLRKGWEFDEVTGKWRHSF